MRADPFDVLTFFPDGGEPERASVDPMTLSPKWSALCENLLSTLGPVFEHNMGSTLAHFDIELGGPVGRLLIHKVPCFEFWICHALPGEQASATVRHFVAFFHRICEHCGVTPSPTASAVQFNGSQGLILFDYCHPETDPDQKMAIAQLGIHLAEAYFRYLESAE